MKTSVLVVEPDEPVARMLARALETAGYEVLQAASGLEALVQLRSAHPSLVILDVESPNQDAWQTLELINQSKDRAAVMAIGSGRQQLEQARQRGTQAFMEKPLDWPALLELLGQLLGGNGSRITPWPKPRTA